MTVAELIKALKRKDANAEVCIEQPTHDHWDTMLAAEVSSVEAKMVRKSPYHRNADKIVSDDPEKYGESDEDRSVVVIG